MLQFLLLFIVINLLFIVARHTSRVIEAQFRRSYWYLTGKGTQTDKSTTTSTTTTKTLPREHLSVRQMLAAYFAQLEDETREKSPYESLLWVWYQQNISAESRARDASRDDALPHWLEQLAWAYNNFWVYNAALLCLFFVVTLGIMWCVPLWGGGAVDPVVVPLVGEARRLAISEAMGHATYHCSVARPVDELCYVEEGEQQGVLQWPHYLTASAAVLTPGRSASSLDGRFLWDREHFQFYARVATSHEPQLIHYWTLQNHLFTLGMSEQQRGLRIAPCVCPAFLGLLDNVTLLYRAGAWLVMPRPTVQRVNAMASLVHSQVQYHYNSHFFDANQRLVQQLQLGEVQHHSSFVVEYDQPQEPTERACDTPELEPRAVVLQHAQSERVRIQLTGDDAICYVYCDTMNGKLLVIN